MNRKDLIEALVARTLLLPGVPSLTITERERELIAEAVRETLEHADILTELGFRTGFADGMERAVGIFQQQAPPDVDTSWLKFKDTL